MGKLVYKTAEIMVPGSFDFGHSVFKIKGLEQDIVIEFLGTFYMEIPRCLNGVEIWELDENERQELLIRRPNLNPGQMYFWKIVSNNEVYYVASLSVHVID